MSSGFVQPTIFMGLGIALLIACGFVYAGGYGLLAVIIGCIGTMSLIIDLRYRR